MNGNETKWAPMEQVTERYTTRWTGYPTNCGYCHYLSHVATTESTAACCVAPDQIVAGLHGHHLQVLRSLTQVLVKLFLVRRVQLVEGDDVHELCHESDPCRCCAQVFMDLSVPGEQVWAGQAHVPLTHSQVCTVCHVQIPGRRGTGPRGIGRRRHDARRDGGQAHKLREHKCKQ